MAEGDRIWTKVIDIAWTKRKYFLSRKYVNQETGADLDEGHATAVSSAPAFTASMGYLNGFFVLEREPDGLEIVIMIPAVIGGLDAQRA